MGKEYERVRKEFMGELLRMHEYLHANGCSLTSLGYVADKLLKKDGMEIRADDQSLPENPVENTYPVDKLTESLRARARGYNEAQQEMLTPDSEGNVWVRVAPKRK